MTLPGRHIVSALVAETLPCRRRLSAYVAGAISVGGEQPKKKEFNLAEHLTIIAVLLLLSSLSCLAQGLPPMPQDVVVTNTNRPTGCDCISRSTNQPPAFPYKVYHFDRSPLPGAMYRITQTSDFVSWSYYCDLSEPEFIVCITNVPARYFRAQTLYADGRQYSDPGSVQLIRTTP